MPSVDGVFECIAPYSHLGDVETGETVCENGRHSSSLGILSHKGNDGTCELVKSAGTSYATAEIDVFHPSLTFHCGCINVLHTTLHIS